MPCKSMLTSSSAADCVLVALLEAVEYFQFYAMQINVDIILGS